MPYCSRWLTILHLRASFCHNSFLFDGNQFGLVSGLCGGAFGKEFLSFHHKRFNDIFAGDLTHWHPVLKDHADAAAKCNSQLRVVRLARTIHCTTHDREMKRFFDVGQAALDLGYDSDKVVNIEPATCRASNNSHT